MLLKKCIDELLPLITALIKESLSTGTLPDYFKEAIIRRLLKKQSWWGCIKEIPSSI